MKILRAERDCDPGELHKSEGNQERYEAGENTPHQCRAVLGVAAELAHRESHETHIEKLESVWKRETGTEEEGSEGPNAREERSEIKRREVRESAKTQRHGSGTNICIF